MVKPKIFVVFKLKSIADLQDAREMDKAVERRQEGGQIKQKAELSECNFQYFYYSKNCNFKKFT